MSAMVSSTIAESWKRIVELTNQQLNLPFNTKHHGPGCYFIETQPSRKSVEMLTNTLDH